MVSHAAGARFVSVRVSAYADYAYTQASYRNGFVLNAGANPAFDDEADPMTVRNGDRRPGVPAHNLKLGLDVTPRPGWTLGLDAQATSGRWFTGKHDVHMKGVCDQ